MKGIIRLLFVAPALLIFTSCMGSKEPAQSNERAPVASTETRPQQLKVDHGAWVKLYLPSESVELSVGLKDGKEQISRTIETALREHFGLPLSIKSMPSGNGRDLVVDLEDASDDFFRSKWEREFQGSAGSGATMRTITWTCLQPEAAAPVFRSVSIYYRGHPLMELDHTGPTQAITWQKSVIDFKARMESIENEQKNSNEP